MDGFQNITESVVWETMVMLSWQAEFVQATCHMLSHCAAVAPAARGAHGSVCTSRPSTWLDFKKSLNECTEHSFQDITVFDC
jgi:hypothetical protein